MVASSGDSIEAQNPEDNMLNPTKRKDKEYTLNISIELFINVLSVEEMNTSIIDGANTMHTTKIPIENIAIVFNVILNKYFKEFMSLEP